MPQLFEQQWLIIAVVFFGIIGTVALIRYKDRKWIERRFSDRQIRAVSFGVNYFGLSSEPGSTRRSSGFLLLLSDRLFFRSRIKGLELDIPGDRIRNVTHGTSHKGRALHQSVIKIVFTDDTGQTDTAAFKVPYPPQWIDAIRNTLINAEV
jgi:hypothetical protein